MFTDKTRAYLEGLSAEELAEYLRLGELELYDPRAIDFARQEFANRNLDVHFVARLATREKVAIASAKQRADEPLDTWWRLINIMFPGAILTPLFWMARASLRSRGEHRKSEEMGLSAVIGAGIWLMLVGFVPLSGATRIEELVAGSIPFAFGLVLVVSARPWTFLFRRSKIREGMCSVCGYDLRATPNRCPECGTAPALKKESSH